MNQEQNNLNTGNNSISNNQLLNSNKVIGYNSQTGQPIYQSTPSNNNYYQNNQSSNNNQVIGYNPQTGQPIYNYQNANRQINANPDQKVKKKKMKWWIPLLLFAGGFLLTFVRTILLMLEVLEQGSPILGVFTLLITMCWLMVIPSLIIVVILYNKKNDEEKKVNNQQLNFMLDNSRSLEEKMLIAYIGNNCQPILEWKFSIPAFFLNWMYLCYRKFYPLFAIALILILISSFLPEYVITLISLGEAIVLGIKFNEWYVSYVKKQIKKIKDKNPNSSEMELINICKQKGNTSIMLIFIVLIILFVIGLI